MSTHWAISAFLLSYLLSIGHCQANYPVQLFHFIPVRLYTPEFLQDNVALSRPTRQQQIVQEVVVENNFGGGGFGIPPPPLFGGLGRPGLGFGGRPSLIPGRGFGGSFGGGFGGSFGGSTPVFRDAGSDVGRSNTEDNEAEELKSRTYAPAAVPAPAQAPAYAPAPAPTPCSAPSPPSAASLPNPPCATNYVFSCQAMLKPVPCASPSGSGCY